MNKFKEQIKPGTVENKLMQVFWGSTAIILGAFLLYLSLNRYTPEKKGGPICFPGGGTSTSTNSCPY